MIETTGATRHIYTPAAVQVRHEMTPDTLATRHHDTAGGKKKEKVHKIKHNNKQKNLQSRFSCPFFFLNLPLFSFLSMPQIPLMLLSNIENANGHDSDLTKNLLRSQSVAFLNILKTIFYLEVGHFFILESIWQKEAVETRPQVTAAEGQRCTRIDKDPKEITNISLMVHYA